MFPLWIEQSNSWFQLFSLTYFYHSPHQNVSCQKRATLRECPKRWGVEKGSFHPHSQSSVCLAVHSVHRPRLKCSLEKRCLLSEDTKLSLELYTWTRRTWLTRWSNTSNWTGLCFLKFGPLITCIRNICSAHFKRILLGFTLDLLNQIFFGDKWFETNQNSRIIAINWKPK